MSVVRSIPVSDDKRSIVKVLVVDDEAEVLDAYRQIFIDPAVSGGAAVFRGLRDKLFTKVASQRSTGRRPNGNTRIVAVFCSGAEAAVTAVQEALAANDPFSVAFLDMRMPPGPDGVWAAARIRKLDAGIEIVVCTAYSDVDPGDIGTIVPPEDKLSYLQKPFHPHEIRQMTVSLGSKWRAEHRIAQLAHFDTLTGLPNRGQSRDHLSNALAVAKMQDRMLAVLYLDLDNFKRVNDTLGHAMGDELLRLVASRLRHALESDDHLGRPGGDEFIAILPDIRTAEDAAAVAGRLIAELQAPMHLAPHTLVVTPSVGISMFPADGVGVDELLRNADLAMYSAKRKGPGMHCFFDPSMNDVARRRFTIEAKLRGALERGEFMLHYQPQFDVATGVISGMEALLRWTHPELDSVPPNEFIPVAEETGLILPIGEWVLRTACAQAKAWRDEGLPVARMAVNVSGQQFVLSDFAATVASIIAEAGIEPAMLELEITESVVMNDGEWAELALRQLKALGVMLAIDDFGTGYSSFARLRHFAVDRLKIDRSFMTRLMECSEDRAIAAGIIAMSRSLRINVTAEGVESLPQLLFLQEQGCHEAQGFLFSRPLSAADAGQLLHRAADADSASRTQRLRAFIG